MILASYSQQCVGDSSNLSAPHSRHTKFFLIRTELCLELSKTGYDPAARTTWHPDDVTTAEPEPTSVMRNTHAGKDAKPPILLSISILRHPPGNARPSIYVASGSQIDKGANVSGVFVHRETNGRVTRANAIMM